MSVGEASASVAARPKKDETRAPAPAAGGPVAPSHLETKVEPSVRNVAFPVERFHAGELDRDGYVGAMIEEATGYLGPQCRAEVATRAEDAPLSHRDGSDARGARRSRDELARQLTEGEADADAEGEADRDAEGRPTQTRRGG